MSEVSSGSISTAPSFDIDQHDVGIDVVLHGDWTLAVANLPSRQLLEQLTPHSQPVAFKPGQGFRWDSRLMSLVYQLVRQTDDRRIELEAMPEGVRTLFSLATAVAPQPGRADAPARTPKDYLRAALDEGRDVLTFIGDALIATGRLLTGRAKTRGTDFLHFVELSGPNAIGIISLTSVLVGMILAYLGAVQLRQFGAQIFVANLVTLGMVREMGPLMTAVIMAGRTGAAYAAQLGTMQTREEIDAITTLGISPMEFLVLPRMLALILVMPMLVMYSTVLGMIGGAIVALGMDITFIQYANQARDSVGFIDFATGMMKSVAFATLISVAGCQAGLNCGRSSAAVGLATTKAVVMALVYLIVADAALNIVFQQLEI